MATEYATVLNVNTGQVGTIPRRFLDHPVINRGQLVEVQADTKPYVPELFKASTAEEFSENHPDKVVAKDSGTDEPDNEE